MLRKKQEREQRKQRTKAAFREKYGAYAVAAARARAAQPLSGRFSQTGAACALDTNNNLVTDSRFVSWIDRDEASSSKESDEMEHVSAINMHSTNYSLAFVATLVEATNGDAGTAEINGG